MTPVNLIQYQITEIDTITEWHFVILCYTQTAGRLF